jgi:hypothetical protein
MARAGERSGQSPGGRRTGASRPRGSAPGQRRPAPRSRASTPRTDTSTNGSTPSAPEIPPEVQYSDLDKDVRARLRSLSKTNAEDVGRHMVMVGLLLDEDPERAYLHAQAAVARGGRVEAVREVAAFAAHATGRYAEALREFRTVRRLSGSAEHLAMEADCERGLGRPERAVAIAQSPEVARLSPRAAIELRIVLAGARMDLGDPEAALLALTNITAPDEGAAARVREATVDVLRALGRDDEADKVAQTLPDWNVEPNGDDVIAYDLEDDQ